MNRNDTIDAFRGVAIIAVVLYHYLVRWAPELGVAAVPWVEVGRLGVELFFVISGLVITMTLVKTESLAQFALHRFARIVPALWLTTAVIFAVLQVFHPMHMGVSWMDLLTSFFLVSGEMHRDYVDGVLWSLNIEIKFYVLIALCYLVLKQRLWIGLCAFGVLGVLIGSRLGGGERLIFMTPYMPFFLFGLALWYEVYGAQRRTAIAVTVIASSLYLANASFYSAGKAPWWLGHAFLAATIGGMAVLLLLRRPFAFGPLAGLGRMSYSLYLIHQKLGVLLIFGLLPFMPEPPAVAIAVAVVTALAWLSYRYVEQPAQKSILRALNEPARRFRIGGRSSVGAV